MKRRVDWLLVGLWMMGLGIVLQLIGAALYLGVHCTSCWR